jgi:hypothetical protein
MLSLPAVPCTCPKQQFPAVASGQPRSVAMAPDPRQRRIAASPTLLPKLAVAWWPWSVLGPHGVGNRWSSAGTSGHTRGVGTAGHRPSTVTTWDGEQDWAGFKPLSLRHAIGSPTWEFA